MILIPLPIKMRVSVWWGVEGVTRPEGRWGNKLWSNWLLLHLIWLMAMGGSGLAPFCTGTHLCNLLLPAARSFLFVCLMHRPLAHWPAHTPQQHLVINRQKHKGSWCVGQLVWPPCLHSPVTLCKSCWEVQAGCQVGQEAEPKCHRP